MSERVKELFGQALDQAVPYTWQNLDFVEVEKIMKVFAELIVKECLSYMEDGDIDFAKFMIKKHFGVSND